MAIDIWGYVFCSNKKEIQGYLKELDKAGFKIYEFFEDKKAVDLKTRKTAYFDDSRWDPKKPLSGRYYASGKVPKGSKFITPNISIWADKPVDVSKHVIEDWDWSPLELNPKLYEIVCSVVGLVSRKDYYYQDGRLTVGQPYRYEGIEMFLDNFTTIDVKKAIKIIKAARSDTELIDAIAYATGNPKGAPYYPNAGNMLVAMGKTLEGEPLTEQESKAALDGLRTEKIQRFLDSEKDLRELAEETLLRNSKKIR